MSKEQSFAYVVPSGPAGDLDLERLTDVALEVLPARILECGTGTRGVETSLFLHTNRTRMHRMAQRLDHSLSVHGHVVSLDHEGYYVTCLTHRKPASHCVPGVDQPR